MGEIIKGKPVGDALSEVLKGECEALVKDGIQPKLAILRVGAKPNDLSYEKGALKKCDTIGIKAEVTELPEGTTQEQYIEALEKLKPALEHHYASNRHHPEHFVNGINDMTLIDVVEMFCDWKASTLRHNDGNLLKSIEINAERFNMDGQLKQILMNTARMLDEHEE